jgi:hypothetical protein
MPKRIGDSTRLTLQPSSRLFNFAHFPKIDELDAFQLAKSLSVGGDRWGHHTLVERL